jgi:two-component system OmpR family sensor kinase
VGELPRRRWTLRTRLVVTQVTLLAAVSVVIGLVSVLTLNYFLLSRLDTQLQAVTRLAGSVNAGQPLPGQPLPSPGSQGSQGRGVPPPNDDGSRRPPLPPGTGIGALSASLPADGRARQGSVSTQENLYGEPLTEEQLEILAEVPVDGRSHAVEVGGSFGGYLESIDATDSGEVLITGLPLRDVEQITITLGAVISGVALLGLLAVGFAGAAMVRLSLRPLRRVAATARRVAQLPLDRGEVALAVRVPGQDTDGHTEVGQVGQALNRMLEHVASALQARQDSETRVRRFVSDAGHELRTPLASIRGYAELTRRSRAEVAPDVAHALERVESEAVRMTGLVEELLLLARLDEGRPLDRVPVDLSQLVVAAVSDAHVAGPGHRWLLDLPEPVRCPVTSIACIRWWRTC